MSSGGGGGSGGGGTIIINNAVATLSHPTVAAMLPPMMRAELRTILVKPVSTWSDDDRWYVGLAMSWAICNVK